MSARRDRIVTYLQAMFPPAVLLPSSLASFLALHFGLQAMGEPSIVEGAVSVTPTMILGALSLFGFSLLLRVYDELKDVETDLRLGRAGDPRYADRPIVTGLVEVADIEALRDWVLVGLVVVNLLIGVPTPFWVFGVVLGLCWMSSRWFFWPAVSRHLLLAFVTHNPLTLAMGLYVLAVYASEFTGDRALAAWPTAAMLLGLWAPVAAWEIGRKIRLPEDETDYETYSKILGWRVAAGLVLLLAVASAGLLAAALSSLSFGAVGCCVPALFAAPVVVAVCRLLVSPSTETTALKPWLEGGILLTNVGMTVLWAASYGVKMGV